MSTGYAADGKKNKKPSFNKNGKKNFHSNSGGSGGKFTGGKNKTRSNYYEYGKKEDEDAPKREFRSKSTKDSKPKEPKQEKMDIKNRLEKEKKVMQKKQEHKKSPARHKVQARPKRSNNIDWTREYENDSYDDDSLDSYL